MHVRYCRCEEAVCDPYKGCSVRPKNCDDGDQCTEDSCDNGLCKHTYICPVRNPVRRGTVLASFEMWLNDAMNIKAPCQNCINPEGFPP